MQRLLSWIFVLSALPGGALLAQDIAGTWQGVLKANGPNGSVELRTVIKDLSGGGRKSQGDFLQHRSESDSN